MPRYIVRQSEVEASEEGRSIADFRYGCVGYSLYVDQKDKASNGQGTRAELPVCVGLEVNISLCPQFMCILLNLWRGLTR